MRRASVVLVVLIVAILTTLHLGEGDPSTTLRVPTERAALVAPLQAPVLDAGQVPAVILPEGAYGEQGATTTTTAATTTTEPPTTTTEPPTTTEAPTTTTEVPPEPEPVVHMTERSVPEPEEPATVPQAAPPGGGWEELRQCESGGDYTAHQRGGPGRGAYQFDQPTWDGAVARAGYPDWVGTSPADAPPPVQDAAALQLYSERGAQPWPYCGRYL